MTQPTHFGPRGEPRMVDVGGKPVTPRRAVAAATVRFRAEVLSALLDAGGPKGDVLVVAQLAGIAAAKRTAELIPLCHPLPLDRIDVELAPAPDGERLLIRAEVAATARTGVEMEALTAASIAALTVYDMTKALQRDIVIERLELVEKEGGASGRYRSGREQEVPAPADHEAIVVAASNRAAAGTRPDESGPALVDALREAGFATAPLAVVVPDDEERLATTLVELVERGYRLILTTGGTGLTPGDVTPAATRRVIERHIPGIAEQMRQAGRSSTPMASLSRGIAGSRGGTLIVNLPGSPRGALESFTSIRPLLRHALEQLAGGDH
ncbi:MAG: bifunctional molybdenum cofactor biosynthesis protein MoaC/MoaB [Chloroflexota bacterium]|nr:bifunctional molybdenum cofactor biosynthesis protein MoaC/MoaB [Chloroflexota bacterium]